MFKNQENKNKIGIGNSKMQGMKFPQKKVKTKELGNISLDLSKEEEIMRKTPGLMENSMIENITAMNSIFAQKQSERLMLNNLNNNLNINDLQNNTINSNQTFNQLVNSELSGPSMSGENPLDMAVIIKDSSEVQEEEMKEKEKEKQKENKKKSIKKKKKKKKKKSNFNKVTILIIFLLIVIVLLIIGLIMTYYSVAKD